MSRRHAHAESERQSSVDKPVRLAPDPAEEEHEIPQDKIAARAYEIWVERGRPEGTHLEDWFAAERELTARYAAASPSIRNPRVVQR